MTAHLVLFVVLGWLLMILGIALAVRHYTESRGRSRVFPGPLQMRWMARLALAGYILVAAGHVMLRLSDVPAGTGLMQAGLMP